MNARDIDALLAAGHLYQQRKVVAALLGTAAGALWRNRRTAAARAPGSTRLPGPELRERVTAPSPGLVRDYARFAGAADDAYMRPPTVPAHMFSQWALPIAARTLQALPYPLARIVNAGCRLEINGPVAASSPLSVRAQLVAVDDDGQRALIQQRIETDTPSHPRAIVADLYAVVPCVSRAPRPDGARAPRAEAARGTTAGSVPSTADELARLHFGPRAGLAFAFLAGDINPVHWLAAYARATGFATPIVHGFALMARAMEALGRAIYAGATSRIRVLDVKFKRPLALSDGVDVGLYVDHRDPNGFYLGAAPGSRAFVVGRFEPVPAVVTGGSHA